MVTKRIYIYFDKTVTNYELIIKRAVAYHGFKSNPLRGELRSKLFDKDGNFNPQLKHSLRTAYANDLDINIKSDNYGEPCNKGIFLTPSLEIAEKVTVSFKFDKIGYKMLLMCRVKPSKVRIPMKNAQLYIISNSEHVRPYGILIKKLT
jgi:hypothetical protein